MSENENVTPIRPEQKPEQPKGTASGKLVKRKLVLMAVIMLLLILLICFFLFRDRLNPGKLKREAFHPGQGGEEIQFQFVDSKNNTYTAFQNALAVVAGNGLTAFDAMGNVLGTAEHVYSTPLLRSGDSLVMACDVGGRRLTAMNAGGEAVLDLETEGTLLDADLSKEGAICCAELLSGYKTVITVYDGDQNQIYRWYSASRYMNQCTVSGDGESLCTAALGQSGGSFESTAVFFQTDSEEPVAEVPLGSQMIWDLRFVDGTTVCAIGESSVCFFNRNGELLSEWSYDGAYLKDYAISENGIVALSLNPYQAGNHYRVITLNPSGEKLAELEVEEELLSLSIAGDYCAVLTPACLYVYDNQLRLCASRKDLREASAAVMLDDGSVILLGGGSGTLYLSN